MTFTVPIREVLATSAGVILIHSDGHRERMPEHRYLQCAHGCLRLTNGCESSPFLRWIFRSFRSRISNENQRARRAAAQQLVFGAAMAQDATPGPEGRQTAAESTLHKQALHNAKYR